MHSGVICEGVIPGLSRQPSLNRADGMLATLPLAALPGAIRGHDDPGGRPTIRRLSRKRSINRADGTMACCPLAPKPAGQSVAAAGGVINRAIPAADRRQPFVNRAAIRSSHGRDSNPCGAGIARPARTPTATIGTNSLLRPARLCKAIAKNKPMTRSNARIVSEYLREAGWGEGAIGAATKPGPGLESSDGTVAWNYEMRNRNSDFNQRLIVKSYFLRASSWRTPEGDGGMRTIPFKPRDPETRTVGTVISWPMKRLTIDVPIDLHICLKTGCAMRGEKIGDVSGP
jgi:hypothetical protein